MSADGLMRRTPETPHALHHHHRRRPARAARDRRPQLARPRPLPQPGTCSGRPAVLPPAPRPPGHRPGQSPVRPVPGQTGLLQPRPRQRHQGRRLGRPDRNRTPRLASEDQQAPRLRPGPRGLHRSGRTPLHRRTRGRHPPRPRPRLDPRAPRLHPPTRPRLRPRPHARSRPRRRGPRPVLGPLHQHPGPGPGRRRGTGGQHPGPGRHRH